MPVQSILFDKKLWSQKDAEKWLKQHKYKISYYGKKVHITKNKLRYRQTKPKKEYRYRTINIGNGIEFIIYLNSN